MQLSLFDSPPPSVPRARRTDPETSAKAAENAAHGLSDLKRIILFVARDYAPGLTRDDITRYVQMRVEAQKQDGSPRWTDQNVRGRIADLLHDGWLKVVGTRKNDAGNECELLEVKQQDLSGI